MRNFKTKSIFLNTLLAMLCVCAIFIFSAPIKIDRVISSASCTKGETVEKTNNTANKPLYTGDGGGKIPFSLFLSRAEGNSSKFITDFYPTFTEEIPKDSKGTYKYIMDEDSIPSFLLSSKTGGDDSLLYNTTLYFRFNDPTLKGQNDNIIPRKNGYANITAMLGSQSIVLDIDNNENASTNDALIEFSVNLQSFFNADGSENANVKCPKVINNDNNTDDDHTTNSETSFLGGAPDKNDVSARTGRYDITIRYSYTEATNITSNECLFKISFYILDYTQYVQNGNPFVFTNTDTVIDNTDNKDENSNINNKDLNYEVYNYNYLKTPIVEIDATKFGLNFVYTTGYSSYSMEYRSNSFTYIKGREPNDIDKLLKATEGDPLYFTRQQLEAGTLATGEIKIYLKNSDTICYTIYTYYKKDKFLDHKYVARFDLKDFETFLIKNKTTFNGATTMQGTYHFDLDFLARAGDSFDILDKTLFTSIPSKISGQKLVIFGYELKYFDQDPNSKTYHEDVTLINDNTHNNFVAYNSMSASKTEIDDSGNPITDATGKPITKTKIGLDTGFLVNIPKYIAVTDQAPLRFHSFGNLVGGNFTADYRSFDFSSTTEKENLENTVLNYFKIGGTTEGENSDEGTNEGAPPIIYGLDYVTDLNNNIFDTSRTYTQGASISGQGIRIMKLIYKVSLPIYAQDGSYVKNIEVTGYQYVVFEIDNTVQNLFIQGYDDISNKAYDFNNYTNKDIRVNLEQKPNTFYAPVNVTYYYSNDYRTDNNTRAGILNLKQTSSNEIYTYKIAGKKYSYFVTNKDNRYTFSDSGYYRVIIRSVISNVPKTYSFIIDKESFANVGINKVVESDGNYLKSATRLTDKLLEGNNSNEFSNFDLYVTNTGFTMSWDEKRSGASSYSYYYFMDITDDNENPDASLFDNENGEYWLTNGLKAKALSSEINTYKNSINVGVTGDARLSANQYFVKSGLYFFYVYDEAGNYFTRIVLIDNSTPASLQGYWSNVDGKETWVNSFDPSGNPANYVNHDTTIYFGTHKAILLPDINENVTLTINDISFTREYDLTNDGVLVPNNPIIIDFNNKILLSLTNFIKSTNYDAIIKSEKINKSLAGTYLTLKNEIVNYQMTPTAVNIETEEVEGEEKEGIINEIYKADIYTLHDPSDYQFVGEAEYMFRVTNLNGSTAGKYICMNFDIVQGTFYGYGNETGEITPHILRKNGATNLNNLKFEYKQMSGDTAKYYELAELSFDFYEFVLDESNSNYANDKKSYPFENTSSESNTKVDMLSSKILDNDRKVYIIDPINIDSSYRTKAGRYVVTRTYVGGDYELVSGDYVYVGEGGKFDLINGKYYPVENGAYILTNDTYKYVGTGGKYYKDETTGAYIDLFELDTITRKYIVYVDHNGIITSTFMVREDEKERIREVGDNISITLSSGYDKEWEWNFKEFFLTSTATLSLDTNKVPIQINIPLSKYFVYFTSQNNSMYCKLNFAKLEITVYYRGSIYSEWLSYTVDGYDIETGLCLCSKLISEENTKGNLIFKKAGQYRIEINDRTGYIDITSNSANNNNLFPTTYSYSFEISHTPPYAEMYVETYNTNKEQFEINKLYNDEDENKFATNIKKSNENGKKDNKVTINWNDAVTPYSAKVNQVNVTIKNASQNPLKFSIDLNNNNYDLLNIANGDGLLPLDNLVNSNFILYFKIAFFENVSTPVIYDNKEYYRFTYELSLDITEEYIYEITLSYVSNSSVNQAYLDENGKSFAETLYTLTIDRTKPFTNIDNLLRLTSEEFLTNFYNTNNINNFKEENFNPFDLENTPSAFTYSFGIDERFSLSYNAEDTLSYFFVRNYDKYDSSYISITPDMVDTVYPTEKAYYTRYNTSGNNYGFNISYPRFAEIGLNYNEITVGSNKWFRIDYSSRESLYNLIKNATGNSTPNGYYEIIERDLAGNYRNYTVYFTEYSTKTNFRTLNIEGYHEQGYSKVDSESDNNITASLKFNITELSSSLGWGKISVKNETLDASFGEPIFFSPFDTSDAVTARLNELNHFFNCEFDTRYSITLSKYNTYFPAITRYINIITNESTAKLPAPKIKEVVNPSNNTTTYSLVFPAYTTKSVLYLEHLELHSLQGKTWHLEYSCDDKNLIKEEITGLSKGIYKAVYEDNYNKENSYSYIVYVGEYYINDFNREYTFEYNNYAYDKSSDIFYSGGDINVTYEGNIYTVWVNGELYSGTNRETNSEDLFNHNCKTFTLTSNYPYDEIPANQKVGGTTSYEIVYRDITDNSIQKTYNFTIFNELPNIELLNAFGGEITSTLEESMSQITSSVVKINWGKIEGCEFNEINDTEENQVSIAKLFTRNQYGEYKEGINVTKGQTISDEGYYKLQIINTKLGNYREIYFVIQLGDFPLYTVTVDKKPINPSPYEDFSLINSKTASDEALINTIYSALKLLSEREMEISAKDFNSLRNQLGFGNEVEMFNEASVGICSLTNIPHFYSIKTPEIIYNSNMELKKIEFVFKNDVFETANYIKDSSENPTPDDVDTDYWTTIYLVYNLLGPIRIEFFAVTKSPVNDNLLKNDLSYLNEDNNSQAQISLTTHKTDYQLYYQQIKSGTITLSWNKLSNTNIKWFNQGNFIRIFDKYGVSKEFNEIDCTIANFNNNFLTSVLVGSGSHQIKFEDIAGNVHLFSSRGYDDIKYYTLDLIDTVIYYLNYKEKDYNPIQYGVFNDELNLVIDSQYLKYYLNASPNISVTRNGSYYNAFEILENKSYRFSESGRYVVELSGSYANTNGAMKNAIYNFTIIDSNSARLAFEFVEVSGYEILQVTRNGEDITDNFRNENGKVLSLFITSSNNLSGNGNYFVTLKYGKNKNDIISFKFTINDFIPTLSCNVEYGGSTTGSIIISYNPSLIYEQLGECYVKVLTYNNDSKTFYQYGRIPINETSFTDESAKNIEITRSNSYFIQVETKNGNVISSFRVNRNEPLNTFAIIIIVIAVVAVIALIIIIVKLRTRMKIK